MESLKKELSKKNKDELKVIAKNANLSNYSKLSKPNLVSKLLNDCSESELLKLLGYEVDFVYSPDNDKAIELAKKANEKQLEEIDLAKKSNKLTIIGILVALFVGIPALILFFGTKNDDKSSNEISNISFADTLGHTFNILLLPFYPDRNCTYLESSYGRQLIERYNTFKDNLNLPLEVIRYKINICPSTDKEAEKIAKENNADLIIWGQYEESCNASTKIRIRHLISYGDVCLPKRNFGDTDLQSIGDLAELRKGYLLSDIDFVVFSSLFLKSLSINYSLDLNKQKELWKLILANSCKYNDIEPLVPCMYAGFAHRISTSLQKSDGNYSPISDNNIPYDEILLQLSLETLEFSDIRINTCPASGEIYYRRANTKKSIGELYKKINQTDNSLKFYKSALEDYKLALKNGDDKASKQIIVINNIIENMKKKTRANKVQNVHSR